MLDQLSQFDTNLATWSPWGRRLSSAVRGVGWAVLVLGTLVLAVRMYRAVFEGVHTIPWAAILFLAPLSYLACGILWILSSKVLQRRRWFQGTSFAAFGVALIITATMSTSWIYDRLPDNSEAAMAWIDFKVPATSISVSIPHQPELEKVNIETLLGTIPISLYTTEQRNVVLMIGVSDYPRGTAGASATERREFSNSYE